MGITWPPPNTLSVTKAGKRSSSGSNTTLPISVGELRPTPIIYVPISTYGHWIGLCHTNHPEERADLIYLMRKDWETVRGALLHEMVHQALVESARDS
jgi:hypothetical protein